jgi:hypothetical protein
MRTVAIVMLLCWAGHTLAQELNPRSFQLKMEDIEGILTIGVDKRGRPAFTVVARSNKYSGTGWGERAMVAADPILAEQRWCLSGYALIHSDWRDSTLFLAAICK